MERLTTRIWIEALIRRAQLAGASAFIVQRGDEARGDVLIKVSRLDGRADAYAPAMSLEGERVFINLSRQGVGPDEKRVDDYLNRAKARDRDLWIVEIEDPQGQHFLIEPVED